MTSEDKDQHPPTIHIDSVDEKNNITSSSKIEIEQDMNLEKQNGDDCGKIHEEEADNEIKENVGEVDEEHKEDVEKVKEDPGVDKKVNEDVIQVVKEVMVDVEEIVEEVKEDIVPKSSPNQEVVGKTDCAGMIFMCSSKTKEDCFRYRVFGLPSGKKEMVLKIYKGMRLFLFDIDSRLLYGIYVAAKQGGYNVEPKAFKSAFPAQVKFNILKTCIPLKEDKFKAVIKDNYYKRNRFNCELTSKQVKNLCRTFEEASKGVQFSQGSGPSTVPGPVAVVPDTRWVQPQEPTYYGSVHHQMTHHPTIIQRIEPQIQYGIVQPHPTQVVGHIPFGYRPVGNPATTWPY